jgi:transcriptional regulator with XRE-family HTH domain
MPTRPRQSSEEQTLRWASRRQSVGARIREIRLAQDLSQEALALESGLSRNMIIGIEWGRKSVAYERLWDIADVLDVPPKVRRPTDRSEVAADLWAAQAAEVSAGRARKLLNPYTIEGANHHRSQRRPLGDSPPYGRGWRAGDDRTKCQVNDPE